MNMFARAVGKFQVINDLEVEKNLGKPNEFFKQFREVNGLRLVDKKPNEEKGGYDYYYEKTVEV